MSQADQPHTTRRSFLKTAPAGLLTSVALSEVAASPLERIERHKAELITAWREAYGEPAVLSDEGSEHLNRYLMLVSQDVQQTT